MDSGSAIPTGIATTSDERTMAVLAQVLQLVGGWIAPLVIFFVKRQSRFITFHALQVLLFPGLCLFLTVLVMGAVFMAAILGIALGAFQPAQGGRQFPELFLAFFAVFWFGFVVAWFAKLLLGIVYGVKAGRGDWAEYPILGGLARKILNIGPGGAVTTS